MNSLAAEKNIPTPFSFFASWKLLAVLVLLLLAKLFSALEGYPPTWCDEIIYTEPAVNYVQTGHYSAPSINRQMESKGVSGLDEHYFLNVPLGAYARVVVYEVFGSNQTGRRLADWIFLLFATVTLLLALRPWVRPQATILAGIVFVLHRIVGDDFGRPDLLSLAFGLLALWIIAKPKTSDATEKIFFGRAYIAGLFIGVSGFCHQFGGVFWAVIVIAVQIVLHRNTQKLLPLAQWLFFFAIGGFTVALTWLPQIASAPQAWHEQFFYMLNVKYHLLKSFTGSVRFLVADTLAKNPVLCLMVLASPLAMKWGKFTHKNFRWTMTACLLLLVIWRCHSFEPYIRQYVIQIWAIICILFAFAFDDWSSWLKQKFQAGRAILLQNATIAAVIFAGSLQTYITLTEAYILPFHETRKEIVALLHNNIFPADRVLVADAFYYDIPARNKSFWGWTEKLDLNDFNVLVAPFPTPESIPVSDGEDRDQWNNCFTSAQMRVFRRDFELVTNVPGVLLSSTFSPRHYRPHVTGCYIYRNTHPHFEATNSPVVIKKP